MKKTIMAALIALGTAGSASAAVWMPSGPQTNVALTTVLNGGWTQCYAATMNVGIGSEAQSILGACQGDLLMMAGRVTGSSEFLVLAAADRDDTIVNTGQTSVTHLANGSNWWFSNDWSWGFTAADDTVNNFSCDTSSSPTSMCLHTLDSVGGYRINEITGLNGSTAYEKVFFVANEAAQVPEPATLGLLGLGLFGFAFARKRKA
jgi:hypothetical protein